MIIAKFSKDVPSIKYTGDYIYNLMLTGCIMKDMAHTIMLKRGCSYEDAMKFVCDLSNKLVYDKNGQDITFSVTGIEWNRIYFSYVTVILINVLDIKKGTDQYIQSAL